MTNEELKTALNCCMEWTANGGKTNCTNCPKDDFCPNADQNSVDFDYNTCFYGMKQYAEEHANKK